MAELPIDPAALTGLSTEVRELREALQQVFLTPEAARKEFVGRHRWRRLLVVLLAAALVVGAGFIWNRHTVNSIRASQCRTASAMRGVIDQATMTRPVTPTMTPAVRAAVAHYDAQALDFRRRALARIANVGC